MARPYSKDLRDRVVGSVAGGRSCRATAALFGVSVASVVKWSQRFRATGSAAAHKMGGWPQLLLKSEREWAVGADRREAGPDAASGGGGAGGTRHPGELRRGVAVLRQRGDHVQKKACTPASRIAPTSPAGGPAGRCTRAGLIPGVWCSSTRPRPSPGQALGQNQHDPSLRALPSRRPPGRQGAARALAYIDLSGGVALRPDRGALRHQRADQWHELSCRHCQLNGVEVRFPGPSRVRGGSPKACRGLPRPSHRATDRRSIPPLLKLTMPVAHSRDCDRQKTEFAYGIKKSDRRSWGTWP
jgi:hypothetical protein